MDNLNTKPGDLQMYDTLSSDYDRFVHWPGRLSFEMPFIIRQLQVLKQDDQPVRVLDAACGTGMHAIALAQQGFQPAGADLSPKMVEHARHNAAQAGIYLRFEASGFGELAQRFGSGSFDALLCLGNSLPHLLSDQALQDALSDFSRCLRPGGLVLIQNRNFDAILAKKDRWMEPQAYHEGNQEWLFVRFYDFDAGLIRFNILTLKRSDNSAWEQQVISTYLKPQLQADLSRSLAEAGFTGISLYGSMAGTAFDPLTSDNLIVTARKDSI